MVWNDNVVVLFIVDGILDWVALFAVCHSVVWTHCNHSNARSISRIKTLESDEEITEPANNGLIS